MISQNLDLQISEIRTRWSKLLEPSHEVLRYYGAVHRYLLGMTKQSTVAQDLANQFAERFPVGKFANADPNRGRLRDLIKVAVRNMVIDYWRAERNAKRAISLDESKLADQLLRGEDDPKAFAVSCRDDLLAQAWESLEAAERADGRP